MLYLSKLCSRARGRTDGGLTASTCCWADLVEAPSAATEARSRRTSVSCPCASCARAIASDMCCSWRNTAYQPRNESLSPLRISKCTP